MGVTVPTLSKWRNDGGWLIEREESDRGLIEDAYSTRKVQVTKLLGSSVEQIQRGINYLAARPEPPTLPEVEKLTLIAANLDRIHRLDTARATENIAVNAKVSFTVDQVRQIIAADPFAEADVDNQ